MALSTSIKYQAFELILHGYGWRTIQHELGVSKGAIDAWRNFIESGDFSWIDHHWRPVDTNKLQEAAQFWIDHPVPFSFVSRKFGLRNSALYKFLQKKFHQLPDKLKPRVAWFWRQETSSLGSVDMIDIPRDRPLNDREYKALKNEIKEARDQLLVAQATWEVLLEECHDEIKKKVIKSYIERTKVALASLPRVD